jgi:DNA-binding NtrC family response regulator
MAKILVIDSEKQWRENAQKFLPHHEVTVLEKFPTEIPSTELIILGTEWIKEVELDFIRLCRNNAIPILVLAAHLGEDITQIGKSISAGAYEVAYKMNDAQQLTSIVSGSLQKIARENDPVRNL